MAVTTKRVQDDVFMLFSFSDQQSKFTVTENQQIFTFKEAGNRRYFA